MKGRCACSLFGIYWELLTKTACLQRAFAAFLPLDFTANSNNTANSRDGNCSETAVLPITGAYGKTIFYTCGRGCCADFPVGERVLNGGRMGNMLSCRNCQS